MKRLCIKVIGAILFMLLVPACVYAGASPRTMDITAYINTDGSVTVEEKIYWKSSGKINGLYRDILYYNEKNPLNSASDLIVDSVDVEWYSFSYSDVPLKNGDSGKYNIINLDGGKQIKIFHPTDDTLIDTTIRYTLKDAVVRYNDVAELYWNFVGSEWENGIESVHIEIILPKDSENLLVYGHGPLEGRSYVDSKKKVVLSVSELEPGEQVEARVVFDKDIVIGGKYQNRNGYEKILAEEESLVHTTKQKKEVMIVINVIISILSVGVIVYVTKVYNNATRYYKMQKVDLNMKYYRELPEDYGVPVMNYLLEGKHKDDINMLATLMDLVRKKYVRIDEVTINNGKKKDYELNLINEDLSKLNKIEQHFIRRMIFVNCKKITLKDLKKKNTKSTEARQKASIALDNWKFLIEKEYEKRDLGKFSPKILKVTAKKLTIVWIPIFVLCVIWYLSGTMDIGGIVPVNIFTYMWAYPLMLFRLDKKLKETDKTLDHRVKWKAFERFLKDFSIMDEKDYKSIVLWEHYLVYAIGLGIADKVQKQLKDIYPEVQALNGYSHVMCDADLFSSFSNSFNSMTARTFTYSPSGGVSGVEVGFAVVSGLAGGGGGGGSF